LNNVATNAAVTPLCGSGGAGEGKW